LLKDPAGEVLTAVGGVRRDETELRALVDPPDVELADGELWGRRSTHLKTASDLIHDHPIERGLHLRTGPRPVQVGLRYPRSTGDFLAGCGSGVDCLEWLRWPDGCVCGLL
jgi:hypothetical protein